jgi:hypothetical protein
MPATQSKSPIQAALEAQTALRMADKLINQINEETAKQQHKEEQRRNLKLLQKETPR